MTPEQEAFVAEIPWIREHMGMSDRISPEREWLLEAIGVIESQQLDWGLLFDDYGQLVLDAEKLREERNKLDALTSMQDTGIRGLHEEIKGYHEQIANLQRAVVDLVDVVRAEDSIVRDALERHAPIIARSREALK